MQNINDVCVFCGSSSGADPAYTEQAIGTLVIFGGKAAVNCSYLARLYC